MKSIILLVLMQIIVNNQIHSKTWTINNAGNTFAPANITINEGDDVNFVLASSHDAREVSEATWNMNKNTPLPGGFQTPFGGGLVTSDKLTVGTHWFVCSVHASSGMKGIIVVQPASGSDDQDPGELNQIQLYPNPVTDQLIIKANLTAYPHPFSLVDYSCKELLHGWISESTTLDLNFLTPGVYILKFPLAGTKRNIKIVKI